MTLHQFKNLSEEEQEFLLQTRAVQVGSLLQKRGSYALFQLNGFYLEVECEPGTAIIRTITWFEETELLEPYLEEVDLSDIYELLGYTHR